MLHQGEREVSEKDDLLDTLTVQNWMNRLVGRVKQIWPTVSYSNCFCCICATTAPNSSCWYDISCKYCFRLRVRIDLPSGWLVTFVRLWSHDHWVWLVTADTSCFLIGAICGEFGAEKPTKKMFTLKFSYKIPTEVNTCYTNRWVVKLNHGGEHHGL